MLSKADNEYLTRIEGDAPMGRMLRDCFWVPAIRAARLEPDGAPIRVRLFGENYVAFRATDGRAGFLDEACPHRRASLLLARNEDCALRCIFHGWKIDVSGKVLEVPNEARNPEGFAAKVKVRTYPLREAGGILWVYLGAWDIPPKFPDFEFNVVPDDQVIVTSSVTPCNWVQAVEAQLDDSHIGLLHESFVGLYSHQFTKLYLSGPPVYDITMRPYGFEACALRTGAEGQTIAAMTHFAMPWYGILSAADDMAGDPVRTVFFSVPIDDVTTQQWFIKFNIDQPLGSLIGTVEDYDPDNICPPMGGPENYWGQDRAAMKAGHFSGFTTNLLAEDTGVLMSMGPISDRSQEHLCSADLAIGHLRRVLLKAAKGYEEGQLPEAARPDVDWRAIRAWTAEFEPGEDWRKAG